jgi:hypothetical protein
VREGKVGEEDVAEVVAGADGPSMAMTGTACVTSAKRAKYSGKVLATQPGSLMRTGTPRAASEKHMAMR